MRLLLLLAFGLSFNLTELFKSESEKELQKLHSTAERAIEQNDYAKAKEAYETILSKISPPESPGDKYKAEWPDYVDAHLRLAEVDLALNEGEKGKKLLETLLLNHPPAAFIPKIKLLQARFLAAKVSPGEAYLLMKEVKESLPAESWTGKELSFFHGVEFSLNEHFTGLTNKAKCLFAAGFYQEAATLYEEVEKGIEKGYFPKAKDPLLVKRIHFHLAECYFSLARFDKTVDLIHTIDPLDPAVFYLAAKAFSERKEYETAIDYYKKYVSTKDPTTLEHYEEALLELGLYYLRKGQNEKAKSFLEPIRDKKGRVGLLSHFHLAKIYLKEGKIEEAQSSIAIIDGKLKKEDPLRLELAFLKGRCKLAKEEFEEASSLFGALASTHTPWQEEIQYHLALTHFQWAKKLEGQSEKRSHLEKAEAILSPLTLLHPQEPYLLTLGEIYVMQERNSFADKAGDEIETLFKDKDSLLSLDGKIQSLLMIASLKKSATEKRALLLEATRERFSSTALFATAWYLLGLSELKAIQEEDPLAHLDLAIQAVEKGFYLSETRDSALTIPLWKEKAKALFYQGEPLLSFISLEELLSRFSIDEREKEEILYLRGLIAAKSKDVNLLHLAEEALSQLLTVYPDGTYASHSLYALGIIAFNQNDKAAAKKEFVSLVQRYPNSSLASRALFWSAECTDNLDEKKSLWTHCFTDYGDAPMADEAYLKLFPLDDYLAGKEEAIDHLKNFKEKFPSSRLLVATHFILGSREEKKAVAKEAFQRSIDAWEKLKEEEREPSLRYFFSSSEIELGRLLCEEGSDLTCALNYLNHAEKILQSTSDPQLFEACEFYLAKCYIQLKEEKKAEDHLLSLLRYFSDNDIKEGYYLSRLWSEQGKIALQKNDPKAALYALNLADECGRNFLSEEEKLELLLLESDVYIQQNRYDLAMRMLSKVINEDVASNLRLKAMYRRAEVYEKESRFLLAYRQLDALAKKSGEWAQKAKDKLKAEYGMD